MKEGIQNIIASKSKTFLAFCFCFILGTSITSIFDWSYGIAYYIYASLFIFIFFLIIFWSRSFIRFFILCSLFFSLGVWRFLVTIPNCGDVGTLCHYTGRQVMMRGWVSEEPDRRVDGARYMVSVTSVAPPPYQGGASGGSPSALTSAPQSTATLPHPPLERKGSDGVPVEGKILISTRLYPEYHYGDEVEIKCRLERPENFEDSTFRYDKYLARYGVWNVCANPVVSGLTAAQVKANPTRPDANRADLPLGRGGDALSPPFQGGVRGGLPWLMIHIFSFKEIIQSHLNQLWNEPESSFMAGLLFGSKSGLPQSIIDDFSKTGVSHIIAVSGFNVTIIVTWLSTVLVFVGINRKRAFWFVIVFIVLFVLFTGTTASVLRAAIMGIAVLVAKQMGRLSQMTNVLAFTAAVMLFGNPYLLVWDAGFQLSFLATIGLVYVSPIFDRAVDDSPVSPLLLRGGQATTPLGAALSSPSQGEVPVTGRRSLVLRVYSFVREPLIQTLSAIIATLPLILYQFGRLSIVAPLVNVLILWTLPWLMLGGFLALVFSFIFYPFGQLIAWITSIGLKYVLGVVEFFGKQSWAAANVQLPLWGMVGMYVVLIYIIRKKIKAEINIETDWS